MVNGWLKLAILGPDNASLPARTTKRAHFAPKSALTSKANAARGRSEVVLDQAILGLLINGRQRLPRGIKE